MNSLLGFLFLSLPVILFALWLALTWLMFRLGKRLLVCQTKGRAPRTVLVGLIATMWFGASFWYGGGRKVYYDAQVKKLCAKDGGVKVYETVKLPGEGFDMYGMVNFWRPDQGESTLGPNYVFKRETTYYRRGNPDLFRMQTQIIRRSDGKLLGESVFYKRGGGDMPGPWHGSSFMCPELSIANDVLRQVFIKE